MPVALLVFPGDHRILSLVYADRNTNIFVQKHYRTILTTVEILLGLTALILTMGKKRTTYFEQRMAKNRNPAIRMVSCQSITVRDFLSLSDSEKQQRLR